MAHEGSWTALCQPVHQLDLFRTGNSRDANSDTGGPRLDRHQIIVFTGLSISHAEAESLTSAEIRPPIKRGDLDELDAGTLVAVIDGQLETASAIQLDEIRRGISRGLSIRGAASVGALRAHEAGTEGMEGIGWVFNAYVEQRISGTDEISVIYDPVSCHPLTIALVNVRFWLEALVDYGMLSNEEVVRALHALKGVEIGDRVYGRVLLELGRTIGRNRLKQAIAQRGYIDWNIKRMDARLLLATMNELSKWPGVIRR